MKSTFYRRIATVAAFTGLLGMGACDLDRFPKYELNTESVYSDFSNYKSVLAKLYAGIAVSGQQGPSGKPDLIGLDEGFSNYLRLYWKVQELTTDEAVIAWNDGSLNTLHLMTWNSGNEFLRTMYNRIYYQIGLCNEFIRQTADGKLNDRSFSSEQVNEVRRYRAEARFLRALSYWHALDMYGNVPFVTEDDVVGGNPPKQTDRATLYNYIVSELRAVEGDLAEPRQGEYGRADKAAAWTLLAKVYLNAEVYTGQANYAECVNYCNRVLNAGYQLQTASTPTASAYARNFLADNHTSPEMIFPIAFDGVRTKTFGGTTFLINAATGNWGARIGVPGGGWYGSRTTKNLVQLYPDTDPTPNGFNSPDQRAIFNTTGQTLEISRIDQFGEGFAVEKFKNLTSANQRGSDPLHPDTDFPMFRLADVYLMYAEATLRGGGGNAGQALTYVNQLRRRGYGLPINTASAVADVPSLSLNGILDERGRELYWEGHRRTDLIRFGKFTSGYNWPFKGNVLNGQDVEPFRALFPLPATDLAANPNLRQNPGYN